MSTKYRTQCIMGRQLALAHMQLAAENDSLPRLVQQIREAVADETGQGAGYLFQIAEVAMFGHSQAIAAE